MKKKKTLKEKLAKFKPMVLKEWIKRYMKGRRK